MQGRKNIAEDRTSESDEGAILIIAGFGHRG